MVVWHHLFVPTRTILLPTDNCFSDTYDPEDELVAIQRLTNMSRHKLVKGLDLDEELNDFDGGVEGEYDDGVSAEDKGMQRRHIGSSRNS